MIIHCLTCGKCISSRVSNCAYCTAEVTDLTLEMNGIEVEQPTITNRFRELVLGLVISK